MTETNLINADAVRAFKAAVGNAHWDINYTEFCHRAGWTEDDYAEDKWREWTTLARALNQFDDQTFARILGVLPPLFAKAEPPHV